MLVKRFTIIKCRNKDSGGILSSFCLHDGECVIFKSLRVFNVKKPIILKRGNCQDISKIGKCFIYF